jgi:hypothetical protein
MKTVEGNVARLLQLTVYLSALSCPIFEFSSLELLAYELVFKLFFKVGDFILQVCFYSKQSNLGLSFELSYFLFGDDFCYGFEFLYGYAICFLFLIA